MRKIFNSIDIGSYEIKITTVEYYNNKYNILASVSVPSLGVKEGLILEPNQVAQQLKKAIKQIENKLGTKINKTIAIIPSNNLSLTIASSKINLPSEKLIDGEIIFSSLQKTLKGNIELGMEVVNVFPIEYKIDNKKVVNPIEKTGKEFEVKGLIAMVPKQNIYSVVSVIESLGIEVMDILISSFGNYSSIKNKEMDTRVVGVIDIGDEKTTVSVFNKGIIIKESILPMGSKQIASVIGFNYKIDEKTSVKIEKEFAVANRKYADGEEMYNTKDRNGLDININQYAIAEIIEKEIVNILKNAKNEIKNLTNREIGYIMITGGITNLLGFNALVEDLFIRNAGVVNLGVVGIRDNKYSASFGAIKYFVNKLELREKEYTMFDDEKINEMLATRKKVGSSNVLGRIFEKFFD